MNEYFRTKDRLPEEGRMISFDTLLTKQHLGKFLNGKFVTQNENEFAPDFVFQWHYVGGETTGEFLHPKE